MNASQTIPALTARELIEKVLSLGADLAGIVRVDDIRLCPSERMFPLIKDGARDKLAGMVTTGLPHGAVKWQDEEKSLLVFAIAHPECEPELDWWQGPKDPPGNRALAAVAEGVAAYVREKYPHIPVFPKPYHVEKGGVYLKDAAAAAGLGVIGRNNLLITERFGPRVRLRAVGLGAELENSKSSDFDPCSLCDEPCRKACPQRAFDKKIYADTGIAYLPAGDGTYCRLACAGQMSLDEQSASDGTIRYCRLCEFACKY